MLVNVEKGKGRLYTVGVEQGEMLIDCIVVVEQGKIVINYTVVVIIVINSCKLPCNLSAMYNYTGRFKMK
jgi:hypothetical protein